MEREKMIQCIRMNDIILVAATRIRVCAPCNYSDLQIFKLALPKTKLFLQFKEVYALLFVNYLDVSDILMSYVL